jgi:hypothetical protein
VSFNLLLRHSAQRFAYGELGRVAQALLSCFAAQPRNRNSLETDSEELSNAERDFPAILNDSTNPGTERIQLCSFLEGLALTGLAGSEKVNARELKSVPN